MTARLNRPAACSSHVTGGRQGIRSVAPPPGRAPRVRLGPTWGVRGGGVLRRLLRMPLIEPGTVGHLDALAQRVEARASAGVSTQPIWKILRQLRRTGHLSLEVGQHRFDEAGPHADQIGKFGRHGE